MKPEPDKNITFVNEISDVDVWILPQTQENLKTTLWGTATASGIKAGEERKIQFGEPGDDGLYIIRMIDKKGFYYSADGLTLEDGYSVHISGTLLQSVTAEVTGPDGEVINTYDMFSARL